MTSVLSVRNVNVGLHEGLGLLGAVGVVEQSRNGPVLVAPGPVVTDYENPKERVLFHFARDANPFFHLLESMWMLAGRNDVAFVGQFAKQMYNYSDDGVTMNGAYGWRWRGHFGFDQIKVALKDLKEDPESRRVVVEMWSATDQVNRGSRDLPCNTHIYFDRRFDVLNMTVCNRSNDILWGCYGANAVHFSVLQEYMANALGIQVGRYRQFSNNFHIYTDIFDPRKSAHPLIDMIDDRYAANTAYPFPIITHPDIDSFDQELYNLLQRPDIPRLTQPFLARIVQPALLCWIERKGKNPEYRQFLEPMPGDNDWYIAIDEWLTRREEAQ